MKEGEIEKELIKKLIDLKYRYRSDINNRALLEKNFRDQFESLNRVRLTDNEFERLLEQVITADTYKASQILRENNYFERDDGTPFHYTLVNIKDWCKNTFEVINQVRLNTDYTHHIYDVVLLINGIPVVQIELKNQQISPSRAMEQIIEYKSDIGNGYTRTLMCFLQIFIVSNQHNTWYFANNNQRHFGFNPETRFLPLYQFADKNNKKITHLETFTEKFLAKCTLGQMISRYMVLVDSEQKLMIMRPYQIYAVKAIMDCVHTNCGNGYIWHTTGSGKTLTSFKASTLLKENPEIEKCLFVVDRKDLDKQTVEEFNRFQEGCVTRNTHTEDLVNRLLSNDYSNKVIVTTIQKLGLALSGSNKKNYKKQLEPLRHKRMVLIFDECHRSQFGDNQAAIKEFFPNAQLFGFTGTPIFEKNSSSYKIEGEKKTFKTTEDVFEKRLHAYTITHAIEDRNVLKFHLDYYKPKGKNPPQPGQAITKKAIINSIFDKHDAATASRKFNAILVTAGIDEAIEYLELFKTLQEGRLTTHPEFKPLNIACVFTPPAEGNKDVRQMQEDLDQERRDNAVEPEKKKQALIQIIEDYNANYGTNHKITEFTQYYSDVQSRVKSHEFPNRDLPVSVLFQHDAHAALSLVYCACDERMVINSASEGIE